MGKELREAIKTAVRLMQVLRDNRSRFIPSIPFGQLEMDALDVLRRATSGRVSTDKWEDAEE